MRLTTIWSIPDMPMLERFRRTIDWSAITLAANLPTRIRYWATIISIAKASKIGPHDREIMSIPLDNILENLEGRPK